MDIVSKERLEEELEKAPPLKHKETGFDPEQFLAESKLTDIQKALEQPVEAQKELTAKIKLFLDHQIAQDIRDRGRLSPFTLKWTELYNNLLNNIQRNTYGDKHTHNVSGGITYADVSQLIRDAKHGEVIDAKAVKKTTEQPGPKEDPI